MYTVGHILSVVGSSQCYVQNLMQVVSSWLNNPSAMSFDNISSDASLCGYQCPVQHARFDLCTSIDVLGWAIGELNY